MMFYIDIIAKTRDFSRRKLRLVIVTKTKLD